MRDRRRVSLEGFSRGVAWLSFVAFLVVYPLALDGTIANVTSGDWVIAFTP